MFFHAPRRVYDEVDVRRSLGEIPRRLHDADDRGVWHLERGLRLRRINAVLRFDRRSRIIKPKIQVYRTITGLQNQFLNLGREKKIAQLAIREPLIVRQTRLFEQREWMVLPERSLTRINGREFRRRFGIKVDDHAFADDERIEIAAPFGEHLVNRRLLALAVGAHGFFERGDVIERCAILDIVFGQIARLICARVEFGERREQATCRSGRWMAPAKVRVAFRFGEQVLPTDWFLRIAERLRDIAPHRDDDGRHRETGRFANQGTVASGVNLREPQRRIGADRSELARARSVYNVRRFHLGRVDLHRLTRWRFVVRAIKARDDVLHQRVFFRRVRELEATAVRGRGGRVRRREHYEGDAPDQDSAENNADHEQDGASGASQFGFIARRNFESRSFFHRAPHCFPTFRSNQRKSARNVSRSGGRIRVVRGTTTNAPCDFHFAKSVSAPEIETSVFAGRRPRKTAAC